MLAKHMLYQLSYTPFSDFCFRKKPGPVAHLQVRSQSDE